MAAPAHYTFGDNALAAKRLALLADAYASSSRTFLSSLPRPARAADLGCGPGHTTRMLDEVLRPAHTLGLDASPAFIAEARASSPPHLEFAEHDVRSAPFPGRPPDLLYARFLITHLPEPREVLATWRQAAGAGAIAALEDNAALRSDDALFAEYYHLVARMQAAHGQALYIGRTVHTLAADAGWRVVSYSVDDLVIDAATMARLHVMNIVTWKHDTRARALFAPEVIARVERGLAEVADGARPAPPVTSAMARLVLSK